MKKLIIIMREDSAAEAIFKLLNLKDVVSMSVEDVEGPTPPPRKSHHAAGEREKLAFRQAGGEPLFRSLEKHFGILKHFYLKEAIKVATDIGYAHNTVSALLSTLKVAGFIGRRDSDGMYYFLKEIPASFKTSDAKGYKSINE